MMKKVVLGLMLASLMQCNAAYSKKQIDEAALAKEIAAVKVKLSEYKISKSGLELLGDVAGATAMGLGVGFAVGGIAQSMISRDLFIRLAQHPNREVSEGDVWRLCVMYVVLQALAGGVGGFSLGLAGKAGSLPKLSNSKLLLTLAIQNVIAAGLNITCNNWVEIGKPACKQVCNDVLVSTLCAQLLALLALILEIIVVRNIRGGLNEEKLALEDSLKELQKILDKAKYDVEPAALLEEGVN
jgi:hypothetical protein